MKIFIYFFYIRRDILSIRRLDLAKLVILLDLNIQNRINLSNFTKQRDK